MKVKELPFLSISEKWCPTNPQAVNYYNWNKIHKRTVFRTGNKQHITVIQKEENTSGNPYSSLTLSDNIFLEHKQGERVANSACNPTRSEKQQLEFKQGEVSVALACSAQRWPFYFIS